MSKNQIDYPKLIDQAMRGVVREVLRIAEKDGLLGDHHFFVSYSTLHPAVKMSEQLRAKYPKEITIVMQHQFWDFKVEDDQFHVTMSFGGVPEKLTIPFAALVGFADPSIKFGLQFQPMESSELEIPEVKEVKKSPVADTENSENGDGEEKIISLDFFRKK